MENNNPKLYEKANDRLDDLYYNADAQARRIGYDRIENGVRTAKLVIFFAVVLAVLLFIQAVYIIIQSKVVFKYSQTAKGVVIAHKMNSDTEKTDYYTAVISFEYGGKHYESKTTGELKKEKDLPAVGNTAEIRFDPNDLSKVYLTQGSGKDTARLVLLIFTTLLNILCILLLVCKSISVFRPESKNKLVAFTAKRSTLSLGIFIAAVVALAAFTTIF